MTCTRRLRPSAVRRRRWKRIGSEPLRSSVSWKRLAGENASPSRRCSSSRRPSSSDLAQQVRQLVGRACRCSSWTSARAFGRSKPRLLDQEVGRLVDAQLAAVHPDVEDDPAGPPDRVGVHDQAEARVVVEALLAHHLLASTCPSPRRTRGRRSSSRVSDGWRRGDRRAGGGGPGRPRGCWCC